MNEELFKLIKENPELPVGIITKCPDFDCEPAYFISTFDRVYITDVILYNGEVYTREDEEYLIEDFYDYNCEKSNFESLLGIADMEPNENWDVWNNRSSAAIKEYLKPYWKKSIVIETSYKDAEWKEVLDFE